MIFAEEWTKAIEKQKNRKKIHACPGVKPRPLTPTGEQAIVSS